MIEGAFARPQASQYVPDSRTFLLTIRSNTKLYCLYKANEQEDDKLSVPTCYESIADISKYAAQDDLICKFKC